MELFGGDLLSRETYVSYRDNGSCSYFFFIFFALYLVKF